MGWLYVCMRCPSAPADDLPVLVLVRCTAAAAVAAAELVHALIETGITGGWLAGGSRAGLHSFDRRCR